MLSIPCPYGLETERLALRQLDLADANSVFAGYTSDLEVARYLPWRRHQTLSETEAMIRHGANLATSQSAYLLAIVSRNELRKPIGLLNLADSQLGVSVGFGLMQSEWGHGYGREIIAHVSRWVLNQNSVWRVWGYCDDENTTSAKVMMRAGMKFEGRLRRFAVHPNLSPDPRDCQLFAAIRE